MKKFRIRYCAWSPFATYNYGKDDKKNFVGILRDIYEGMKIFMGRFEYEPMFQPNSTFGIRLANGSFSGMLGATVNNETDISGPYQINEERFTAVEFTIPLGFSQNGVMSGMVETAKHPFLIFGIFSLPVWIALLVSITFISAATTLIYHILPSSEKRSIAQVFFKYFWAYQTSLLDENFGSSDRWFIRHVCNSPSFRLLQLSWFIGPGLVLLYAYQGCIISAFAANKIKPKIESLEDLIKDQSVDVISIANGSTQRFFESLQHTRYASIWERMKNNLVNLDSPTSVPPWMDTVEEGKAVFPTDSRILMSLVNNRFLKIGKCGIRVSKCEMGSTYICIAFRKEYHNTNILKQFNRGLRRFTEGDIAHFSLLRSNLYYDKCAGENTSVTKPLNLKDLFGAFIVLTTGNAVSLIVVFVELLVDRRS